MKKTQYHLHDGKLVKFEGYRYFVWIQSRMIWEEGEVIWMRPWVDISEEQALEIMGAEKDDFHYKKRPKQQNLCSFKKSIVPYNHVCYKPYPE
jgi:hypothetical protein